MRWSNKTIRKWLRLLHRNLGYLMAGLTLAYGISGYLLNHMEGSDPAFISEEVTLVFDKNLDRAELAKNWNSKSDLPKLHRILSIDNEHFRLMLDGGLGIYERHSGLIDYEYHKKRPLIYFINKLHYNKVKHWTIIADIYAFSLIFFALSGLFLTKGPKGLSGNGKWYLGIGILIPLLYLFWI